MSVYFINIAFGLLIVVLGYFSARAKPNAVLGVRLPATYAYPEVWRKTNQKSAQITYILGPAISVVSLLLYLSGAPEIYGQYLTFAMLVPLLAMVVYLYFYSKNLLEKILLQPGATALSTVDNVGISKVNVISLLVAAIALVGVGILLIYSHAGTSIGIRVGNVFRDAATWHKVNTVGGIGDIIVGAFFALCFARFIPGVRSPRTFYRAVFCFFATVLLWAIVSVAYAYLV